MTDFEALPDRLNDLCGDAGSLPALPRLIRKLSFELPANHPAQVGLFAAHDALVAAQQKDVTP